MHTLECEEHKEREIVHAFSRIGDVIEEAEVIVRPCNQVSKCLHLCRLISYSVSSSCWP